MINHVITSISYFVLSQSLAIMKTTCSALLPLQGGAKEQVCDSCEVSFGSSTPEDKSWLARPFSPEPCRAFSRLIVEMVE